MELVEHGFYLISTLEDTETGYSASHPVKIIGTHEGKSSINRWETVITYRVQDVDGATQWVSHNDFISRLSDEYIERMLKFWDVDYDEHHYEHDRLGGEE